MVYLKDTYDCHTCNQPYERGRQYEKQRGRQNECTPCAKARHRVERLEARKNAPCRTCGEHKPRTLEFFPPHKKTSDGLDSWCRACRASYRSETRRGKYRDMISDEELLAKLAAYAGCEICGDTESRPVVDHCHEKMVIRGILCDSCNMGLGKFYDNPASLQNAIKYLEGFGTE